MTRLALIGALLLAAVAGEARAQAPSGAPDGPLAATRRVLERSSEIVRGPGDRKEKLLAQNFRSQFDSALAKTDFQGLLDTLRKKLDAPAT